MIDAFDRRIRAKFANVLRTREDMHDYQGVAVEFARRNPFSALFLDLGLGKSISMLTLIVDLLNEFKYDKVLVIGPMRVATQTWPNEIAEWRHTAHLNYSVIQVGDDNPAVAEAGRQARSKARLEGKGAAEVATAGNVAIAGCKQALRIAAATSSASVHIISRDWIEWLVEYYGPKWPYRMVVIDECFVAGTLISTNNGLRAIDTLEIGDLVKTPYGCRPISKVIRKTTESLIKITLSNGAVIECTANHRFLTDIGWCNASELNDRILYDDSDDATLCVRALWGSILDMEISSDILQSILPNQRPLGTEARCNDRSCEERHAGQTPTSNLEQRRALVRGSESQTTSRLKQGAIYECSWRQRYRDDETRILDFSSAYPRMASRISNPHGWTYSGLSDMLQGGLCLAGKDALLGSGWRKSQLVERQSPRCKEDPSVSGQRVVSIESVECRGGRDVFDLSVEGAPFYYAGGCLVHNCTSFKDHKTARFKALAKVRNHPGLIERIHLLTATPAAESYAHLFAQMFLLDGGERFGKKITPFLDEFFTLNRYTRTYKLRPNAEEQILAKIADICLVMKAKDHLKLAEPQIIRRPITLGDKEMALYDKMASDFVVTLPDGSEVEAETAAALSAKLLQMASGVLYETYLDQDIETEDFKKIKKVHHIHDHKVDELRQIVEDAEGSPILVAYHWKSSLARLQKAFPQAVVMDRDGKCVKPWNSGKIPMLLMHPQSGGHGLNLQHGGHILVIFDLFHSLELFLQLVGRLARQGQKHPVLVYMLTAVGTVDEAVASALKAKEDAQDKMFAMLRRLIARLKRKAEAVLDVL